MKGRSRQKNPLPLRSELRSQRLIELNGSLVPLEHLPVDPITAFLYRNSRYGGQQSLPDSARSKSLSHEQVLQKDAPPHPSGIVAEEKSISSRLPIPFSNQGP